MREDLTPSVPLSRDGALLLSVVVPCKNEEAVVSQTHRRLVSVLEQMPLNFEVIYVDDGSSDSTRQVLREMHDSDYRVRIVRLSRNFGQQVALTAGLQHASGDAVVIIDADLQDPPEVIPEMVARWREGYEVAYGARTDREGETAFKLWTAKLFYLLIDRISNVQIPLDTGDFRLMDRQVVEALLAMPERDRFLRGMVSWLGFRQVAVPYRRAPRSGGHTHYNLFSMLYFAIDGIASFSVVPLKLATWLGFSASGLALILVMRSLFYRLFTNNWDRGWTALFVAILFMGGVQLVCLGIIGEYVGRAYGESKRRPLYIVQERVGFEEKKPLEAKHTAAS